VFEYGGSTHRATYSLKFINGNTKTNLRAVKAILTSFETRRLAPSLSGRQPPRYTHNSIHLSHLQPTHSWPSQHPHSHHDTHRQCRIDDQHMLPSLLSEERMLEVVLYRELGVFQSWMPHISCTVSCKFCADWPPIRCFKLGSCLIFSSAASVTSRLFS